MSKERELLERVWASERWDMPEDLQADIQELLAQPEPFMLKNRQLTGSLISYDEMYKKGYAQAKIDLKPEQEPVAWCQMVEGKVQDLLTSFEMKDWLYDKSWMPLYTTPPKREALSEDEIFNIGATDEDLRLGVNPVSSYSTK